MAKQTDNAEVEGFATNADIGELLEWATSVKAENPELYQAVWRVARSADHYLEEYPGAVLCDCGATPGRAGTGHASTCATLKKA